MINTHGKLNDANYRNIWSYADILVNSLMDNFKRNGFSVPVSASLHTKNNLQILTIAIGGEISRSIDVISTENHSIEAHRLKNKGRPVIYCPEFTPYPETFTLLVGEAPGTSEVVHSKAEEYATIVRFAKKIDEFFNSSKIREIGNPIPKPNPTDTILPDGSVASTNSMGEMTEEIKMNWTTHQTTRTSYTKAIPELMEDTPVKKTIKIDKLVRVIELVVEKKKAIYENLRNYFFESITPHGCNATLYSFEQLNSASNTLVAYKLSLSRLKKCKDVRSLKEWVINNKNLECIFVLDIIGEYHRDITAEEGVDSDIFRKILLDDVDVEF